MANIVKKEKEFRKSYSYYLLMDVSEAIDKIAKREGVTASFVVESILMQDIDVQIAVKEIQGDETKVQE